MRGQDSDTRARETWWWRLGRWPTLLSLALSVGALALVEAPGEVAAAGVERASSAPGEVAPDLRVVSASFGTFDANGVLTPASRIPLTQNLRFGWRICVETSRDELTWREDFRLPTAPKTWGVGPETTLSHDRRRAVTTREEAPLGGCLDNFWIMVEGDPRGSHSMIVDLEGVQVANFRFEIH